MYKLWRKIPFLILLVSFQVYSQDIVIGSKRFPESKLLAEIMAQHIEQQTGLTVERKTGLAGTMIAFEALKTQEIDLYPEYTGTVLKAILKLDTKSNHSDTVFQQIDRGLQAQFNITTFPSLGFNNTYAIVARKDAPWNTLSEMASMSKDIRFGFSNEFISRDDGLKGLKAFYHFDVNNSRGMEHGLAYQALENGKIDVTDAYSTDGQLQKFNFKVILDDQHFFPPYDACPLVHQSTLNAHPELKNILYQLKGLITDEKMQALNYRHEVEQIPTAEVAQAFLKEEGLLVNEVVHNRAWNQIQTVKDRLWEHIVLTLLATFISVIIGIPLGVLADTNRVLSRIILSVSGVIQTIPSLALLGFMIPLLGIGVLPALVALVLYGLLPIVRNTYTGLKDVDPHVLESGKAMGMSPAQVLFQVSLPLSTRSIMGGIKTSMVINIGTATLAAFIGAGGLGELIITGITLNDHMMIMMGALPAALLALITESLISWIEKRLI